MLVIANLSVLSLTGRVYAIESGPRYTKRGLKTREGIKTARRDQSSGNRIRRIVKLADG